MDKNYKVYVHINKINGKRYYGITKQKRIKRRWGNGKGYKEQPYFYSDIEKYGWDNFEHIVLFDNLTKEESKLLEQMYIALYDSYNKRNGYNISLGEGYKGLKHTEDTKAKISKTKKGTVLNEKHKQKISKSMKGKNAKPIYCIELDMYFETVTEGANFIGCSHANVSRVLNGKQKACKGYHFIYKNKVS